jgi:hypothetical protein
MQYFASVRTSLKIVSSCSNRNDREDISYKLQQSKIRLDKINWQASSDFFKVIE